MLQGAKIRNLGAAIWRAILNMNSFAYQGVCLNTVITFTKNYRILPMHSNVTIKNVSWPHFSWATLYTFPLSDMQSLKGLTIIQILS